MKDRLLKFLREEKLSATKFADEIGVQRSSISHILSGRNKPSYDFIFKTLDKYANLNAEWIISGKGDMYKVETGHMAQEAREQVLFDNKGKVKEKGVDEEKMAQNAKERREIDIKEPVITSKEVTSNAKSIKKVIIFYSDGTFKEYSPEE